MDLNVQLRTLRSDRCLLLEYAHRIGRVSNASTLSRVGAARLLVLLVVTSTAIGSPAALHFTDQVHEDHSANPGTVAMISSAV